jgi:hypothetical protein
MLFITAKPSGGNMAGVQGETEVDIDYSAIPVPYDARMPKGALTMAWWAMCSAMFWLVVAATLAVNFGSQNALLGLALSVVVYSLINGVIVRFAIKTGLSVALFSPILFGEAGAAIATVIFFATAIYYGVFEGSVIAVALHSFVPSISMTLMYLIVVSYSVLLIFGSVQRWLDKLNGVLLPFYLLGLGGAVAAAIAKKGLNDTWLHMGPNSGAITLAGTWSSFTYLMGVFILMMFTFDYARLGKVEDTEYHAKINFGWPFYIFIFLINGTVGIFLTGTVGTHGSVSEISVVFSLLELMGIFGLLFIWVSQTRINTANFYLAATNMHAFGERILHIQLPRFGWSVIVGIIVFLLMLTNVFSYILQALAYQGIFVVAWVAIAVTHMLLHPNDETLDTESLANSDVQAFHAHGLLAWFGSSAVGIILANSGGIWHTFAAPATAVLAFCVYAGMLSRARRQRYGEQLELPNSQPEKLSG